MRTVPIQHGKHACQSSGKEQDVPHLLILSWARLHQHTGAKDEYQQLGSMLEMIKYSVPRSGLFKKGVAPGDASQHVRNIEQAEEE